MLKDLVKQNDIVAAIFNSETGSAIEFNDLEYQFFVTNVSQELSQAVPGLRKATGKTFALLVPLLLLTVNAKVEEIQTLLLQHSSHLRNLIFQNILSQSTHAHFLVFHELHDANSVRQRTQLMIRGRLFVIYISHLGQIQAHHGLEIYALVMVHLVKITHIPNYLGSVALVI